MASLEEILQEKSVGLLVEFIKKQEIRINRLEEEIKRLVVYHDVRSNKVTVLREMLTTFFRKPITTQAVQDEPLLAENDPRIAAQLVQHWLGYYKPDEINNCDINARVSWATLQGGKTRKWVDTIWHTSALEHTLLEWESVRKQWVENDSRTLLMIRFVDTTDSTDGHTVLLYKHLHVVWTVQAYFGVCSLTLLERDIFVDGKLLQKMLTNQKVYTHDFGLIYSSQWGLYTKCKFIEA